MFFSFIDLFFAIAFLEKNNFWNSKLYIGLYLVYWYIYRVMYTHTHTMWEWESCYWNSWNSVKPHRGIEEVLTPSKRVLTPSIPWQYPYWVPNTLSIPLWGRYWVPNTCFEKHSLINRELCERSFPGFLKQHDTFYNHACKVFQQYRIIYNSTEYSWFSAWKTLVDVLKISRSILVHDTGYINGKT